jgi:HK97 family phage portal protein
VRVGTLSALFYAPFWQGVSLVSGDLGSLPIVLYKRTPGGKEPAEEHPAYKLFSEDGRANEYLCGCSFKELIQSHALAYGNGRAGIVRNGRGEVIELVPFLPDRSREDLDEAGNVIHLTKLGDDRVETIFQDEDVFHIKGLSFDGLQGYNLTHMARNSIGLGLGAEKHGNKTFRNAARPAMVLETDGRFKREDALQVLADWNEQQAGAENTGKTALLQGGLKAKPVSHQNDHAQWLETRKFQRQEVASWLGIPPHKLGDDSRISYNSLEEENRAYLQALARWFTKWEEECFHKLLTEDQKRRRSHLFRFDTERLTRADASTRWSNYQIARTIEVLNPNEIREREGLNKRPGGDEYGNPNVASGGNGESPEMDDDEPEEETPAARIVRNRIETLMSREADQLVDLAATASLGSFDRRAESITEKHGRIFREHFEDFGVSADLADQHVAWARDRLRQATTGLVAKSKIRRAVESEVRTWSRDRAGKLASLVVSQMGKTNGSH